MNSVSRTLLIFSALIFVSPAIAAELCGLAYGTWQDLFQQLQANQKLKEIPSSPGFKAYSAEAGRTWTITQVGNRAHPAVACRSLIGPEGAFKVETRLACFASKSDCDKLADGYRRLDEEMSAELKKRRSP